MVHAGKRIENRDKRTSLRGPLIIQAAKECPADYYADAVRWMVSRGLARHPDFIDHRQIGREDMTLPLIPPADELPRGVLLARARVTGLVDPKATGDVVHRWHMLGKWGWMLEQVVPLEQVTCKGMPGIFPVPSARVMLPASYGAAIR